MIIKDRIKEDQFYSEVYDSEENTEIFRQNELLLNAIFTTKAINKNNTYLELEKPIFVQVLKEAGIIKIP